MPVPEPKFVKPAAPAPAAAAAGEADVLVVDGNGAILNQYRNELYKLGFSVHVARTGQDGIRKLGLTAYAFLLINVELSDMPLQEFLDKVKLANGGLGGRILCGVVPGGKADGVPPAVKSFTMPLGPTEFQSLVKQVSGRG